MNYPEDTHQDHRALAEATLSATRYIRNVLFYEGPTTVNFQPNVFVDISNLLDPVLTGVYDTADVAWDVDISAGYAYVADGEGGLTIIRLNPQVTSGTIDASSMSATIPAGFPVGTYHVVATNPDGLLDVGSIDNGYFINTGTPP